VVSGLLRELSSPCDWLWTMCAGSLQIIQLDVIIGSNGWRLFLKNPHPGGTALENLPPPPFSEIQSNVSAVSDSDVGDQYMFITILTDFHYVIDLPVFPTNHDSQSITVFFCLSDGGDLAQTLALTLRNTTSLRQPTTQLCCLLFSFVSAIASNWLFLTMCPTNRICLFCATHREKESVGSDPVDLDYRKYGNMVTKTPAPAGLDFHNSLVQSISFNICW